MNTIPYPNPNANNHQLHLDLIHGPGTDALPREEMLKLHRAAIAHLSKPNSPYEPDMSPFRWEDYTVQFRFSRRLWENAVLVHYYIGTYLRKEKPQEG